MDNNYTTYGNRQLPACPGGQIYIIRPGDTIYQLALRYGVSVDAILAANPGLDPDRLQVGQRICIPVPPCPNGQLYTIRPGDTLFRIAQRFRVSLDALLAANPGIDPDRLYVGQRICIPRPGVFCPNGQIYTIRAGDTFFSLAQRFQVGVNEIIAANPGVNPNALQIGQRICIPRPSVTCPTGQIYVVRPGDTLFRIAQRFNITLQQLLALNPQIEDPENLSVGQNICVPRQTGMRVEEEEE